MNIKFQFQDEKGRNQSRFLNELPSWESLGNNQAITLSQGGKQVVISSADEQFAPKDAVVFYRENHSDAWQNFGADLQDAIKFAQSKFA